MTTQGQVEHRVLDTAERLFGEHGFASVRLRQIADELSIKPASLYYYAPGGKQDLYCKVVERSMERHEQGMRQAVAKAGPELEARLNAIAEWVLSQPRMNLSRMMDSDMSELTNEAADRLRGRMYRAMFLPIIAVFEEARQRGEIEGPASPSLTGALIAMVQGVQFVREEQLGRSHMELVAELVTVLKRGLRPEPDVHQAREHHSPGSASNDPA